jgi:SH3 domain protein
MKYTLTAAAIVIVSLLAAPDARSESAWVSDEFEITLRSGPSTSNAIQLMVSSGTELEVLERDAETDYTRVRTAGGTEGWVLSRYLMTEASAREQLQTLTGELTSANTRGTSLNSQLSAIRDEYDASQATVQGLERDNARLEQELADIRRTAANVIAINEENTDLRDQVDAADIRVDVLEQENRGLESQAMRYWFMSGGLVLVVGIVLGLWLPRMRWQRRSRYDRF